MQYKIKLKQWHKIVIFLVLIGMFIFLLYPKQENEVTIGIISGSSWDVPQGISNSNDQIDYAIELFHQQHPETKVTYVSGIRMDDYQEWLSQSIMKDKCPDVFLLPSNMYDTFAHIGALKPLDSLLENDPTISKDDFYSVSYVGDEPNSLYALPYQSVPNLVFVNKTLLEQLQIEVPNTNWTWNDLYTISEAISTYNKQNQTNYYSYVGYDWLEAVYSNNGSVYNSISNEVDFGNSQFIQAIEYMRKLTTLNVGTNKSDLFDKGQVAFSVMNYSDYRTYMPYPYRVKKFSNFEWDCVALPSGINGDNISSVDTLSVAISANTNHTSLAWDFAKVLAANQTYQSYLVKEGEGVSVLPSVMKDEEVLEYLKEDNPGDSDFNFSSIDEVMNKGVAVRNTQQYSQVLSLANETIVDLMHNETDINNALVRLSNEINEYLKK